MVKRLREDKCGIDGVGFSSHGVLDDENDHVLQGVAQNIKRYEDIGVKVHFTEVDVSCKPEDPKTLQGKCALGFEWTDDRRVQ